MTREEAYKATLTAVEKHKEIHFKQVMEKIKDAVHMAYFDINIEVMHPDYLVPRLQKLGYSVTTGSTHHNISWKNNV